MIINVSTSVAGRFLRESLAPVVIVSLLCHVLFFTAVVGLTKAMYKSHEYERPHTFDLVRLSQIFEAPPEPKLAAPPKLKTAAPMPVAPAPPVAPPRAAPVEEKTPAPSEQRTAAPAEPQTQQSIVQPQAAATGAPGPANDAQVSTDNVYEEGMVDEPPVPYTNTNPKPFYPAFVQDRGITGIVRAQVTIDEKGNVIEIRILGSPHELLTDEVMKAVSRWKYKPGKIKGVPVKVKNRPVEIEFKLD